MFSRRKINWLVVNVNIGFCFYLTPRSYIFDITFRNALYTPRLSYWHSGDGVLLENHHSLLTNMSPWLMVNRVSFVLFPSSPFFSTFFFFSNPLSISILFALLSAFVSICLPSFPAFLYHCRSWKTTLYNWKHPSLLPDIINYMFLWSVRVFCHL